MIFITDITRILAIPPLRALCKNMLAVLTSEWLLAYKLEKQSLWEWYKRRIAKPNLRGWSYNHITPTTLKTSVKESLQMHFKATGRNFLLFKSQEEYKHSHKFWEFSVCCGCKMTWASCLSGCLKQLVSNTKNKTLITTISLANLQTG